MWHKSEWFQPPSDNSMQDGIIAMTKGGKTFNVAVGDLILFKAFYGVGPHRSISSPHIVLGKIVGFSSSRSNKPTRLHYVPWRQETGIFAEECYSRAGIVLWPHGIESFGIHPDEVVKVGEFESTAAAAYRYNLDSTCKVLEQALHAALYANQDGSQELTAAKELKAAVLNAAVLNAAVLNAAVLNAAVLEAKARLEKAGGEVPSEAFFGFSPPEPALQPEQPALQPAPQPVPQPVLQPVLQPAPQPEQPEQPEHLEAEAADLPDGKRRGIEPKGFSYDVGYVADGSAYKRTRNN